MDISAKYPLAIIPGGNLRSDRHLLTNIEKICFGNDSEGVLGRDAPILQHRRIAVIEHLRAPIPLYPSFHTLPPNPSTTPPTT